DRVCSERDAGRFGGSFRENGTRLCAVIGTKVAKAETKLPGVLTSSIKRTLRRVIFAAGIALWLGSMLVQTRLDGAIALWTGALLLGGLFVLSAPTRTVTIGQLIQPLSLGGAMLGVALVISAIFDRAVGPGIVPVRDITVPLAEELVKILPILWILWRERGGRAHTFGVTDLLVLATASGVGFGLVEEAFIRHNEGWAKGLWWLPTSEMIRTPDGAKLIVGHGVWTGLAGLGLGFALLLRRPRAIMALVAVSGLLWSAIDHTATNYGATHRDALANGLGFITGAGWVTAYLFLLGVGAAILLDLYVAITNHRRLAEARLPRPAISFAGLRELWAFERLRRQFAYTVARYRRETGLARARSAVLAANLDAALVNWQYWWRERSSSAKAS
ncbi:MAG: PrsW family glutamic-type intramembrane protease, partial [Candidatus Binatia bacterium]